MREINESAGTRLHCLVLTPLGAMNALHYWRAHRERYDSVQFYVISTNAKNLPQIEKLLCESDLPEKARTPFCLYRHRAGWRKWLNYISLLRCRWLLGRLARAVRGQDDLLVSHLNNSFSRTLIAHLSSSKQVIVVDDGVATFAEFMQLQEQGALPGKQSIARSAGLQVAFETWLFDQQPVRADRLAFYSVFPLEAFANDRLQSVILPRAQASPPPNATAQKPDRVYFIGQPVVRRGVISVELYRRIFQVITAYYRAQNLPMIYIPHRNESPEAYHLDCEILPLDEPFELFAARQGDGAALHVAGFCSTCLLTSYYAQSPHIVVEAFWGFDALSTDAWPGADVIQKLFDYEASQSEQFTINTTLNLKD